MSHGSSYYSFLYDGFQDANLRAEYIVKLERDKKFSILEAHAGDGVLSLSLSSLGYQVAALEDNPILFAILLEKFKFRKDLRPFLSPLPMNLMNLDSSNEWDLVLFSNAISFIDDGALSGYLAKAHKLLSPGGLLVINSPQQTPMRKEQPLAEIHKKVYGFNTIRQLASSRFSDNGTIKVNYTYEVYYKSRLMFSTSSEHELHLRDSDYLVKEIQDNHFIVERVTNGWTDSPINLHSPNYVVVARKVSSGIRLS